MMIKSTYTEAGWDFENIWAINEYVDYPHFQWELRPIIEAVDSDNDGFPDIIDDFPNDPVISLDTDGDGSPDEWLLQKNRTNSTTGLHLDAFPLDPAASIDSDRDGMPDEWNPGMDGRNSTSDPPLELDPYPGDPDNEGPDGGGPRTFVDEISSTCLWGTVIGVAIILLGVAGAVYMRKRKG